MDRLTKLFVILNCLVVLAGLALTDVISWSVFSGILLFMILVSVVLVLLRANRTARVRCPRCRQLIPNRTRQSSVLGVFNNYSATFGGPQAGDDDFGFRETVPHLSSSPHVKLKVHYRCDRCGFEWDATKVEKLS